MQRSEDKKKSDSTDNRIFARLPVKLSLRFLERGREREIKAQTVDISNNGIGFISKQELSPNTPLEMWLDMPDYCEPLYIIGKAIWSKNLGADTQEWRTGVYLERVNLIELGRIYYRKSGLS